MTTTTSQMNWTCARPGHWTATSSDGAHTATASRAREGIIHSHEHMWITRLDGKWIDNADTLADAKRAVDTALFQLVSAAALAGL